MTVAGAEGENLRVFAYAVAEKAELYLRVVDHFARARERFRLQLRPPEVASGVGLGISVEEISAALEQLASWGNLTRLYDSAAPETLAEFYARRFLYQLTPEGVAAHEGVRAVRRAGLDGVGRLSAVLLPGIVERLEAICREAEAPDPARLYGLLVDLFGAFAELAENAGRYMTDLAVETAEIARDDDHFLAYKQAVFVYLNEFVSRLAEVVPNVARLVDLLEPRIPNLLAAAAAADEAPSMNGAEDGLFQSFLERWAGVRSWFLTHDGQPPVVDALRGAMVDALNRILSALSRLNERHVRRVTREADFAQLSRWFSELPEDEAHGLWDLAFGLYSARHFSTLAGDEELDRGHSFWEVAPVELAPRLRASGRRAGPGRAGHGADYSEAKLQRLAEIRAVHAQAEAAMLRLADRTPALLSDLGLLDADEFAQFLSVVEAALASTAGTDGTRVGSTPTVTVTLRPVASDQIASIRTTLGTLRVPEQHLVISLLRRAIRTEREELG